MERGETQDVRTSVKYIDAFGKDTEAYTHIVGHKTEWLRLTVNIDPGKTCRDVRGFLRYGGQIHQKLNGLEVYGDRCRTRLDVNRPRLGAEYRIEWDW